MKDKTKLTNKGLAKDLNNRLNKYEEITSRQISKSRKRGYVTDKKGEKIKFTAPMPVIMPERKPIKKKKEKNNE